MVSVHFSVFFLNPQPPTLTHFATLSVFCDEQKKIARVFYTYLLKYDEYPKNVVSPKPALNDVRATPTIAMTGKFNTISY
jgi:hypothetical protein